jgi:hypothetical protein
VDDQVEADDQEVGDIDEKVDDQVEVILQVEVQIQAEEKEIEEDLLDLETEDIHEKEEHLVEQDMIKIPIIYNTKRQLNVVFF